MKYLIMFLFLPNVLFAKCHVTSELDQWGAKVIKCTKGFVPSDRLQDAPLDDAGNVLKQGAFLKEVVENSVTVYKFDALKKKAADDAVIEAKDIDDAKQLIRKQRWDRHRAWCDLQIDRARDVCELILGL